MEICITIWIFSLENIHLKLLSIKWRVGIGFNKKVPSYQYRKSHCGDKTTLLPSYLHNLYIESRASESRSQCAKMDFGRVCCMAATISYKIRAPAYDKGFGHFSVPSPFKIISVIQAVASRGGGGAFNPFTVSPLREYNKKLLWSTECL